MADNQYRDFDLRIWSGDGGYVAQVNDSPAGPSRRESLRPPFGAVSQEILMLKLENAVLRGGGYRGGPISSEEKVLRQFGSEMFRIVFKESGTVASTFAASLAIVEAQRGTLDGLRIKLTVEPPELAALPWEYMFDESEDDSAQNYLCLRNRSPLVRFQNSGRATSPFLVKGPLNILGMIANPRGEWKALDTERERRRIDDAIASIRDKAAVNFQWVQGETQEHLMDMVQREAWHVFHFIGHGGTEEYEEDGGPVHREGFIVLGDGRGGAAKVPASDIAMTLDGSGTLQLAVLNCCESARGTGVDSPGAALVKSGVPAVVAMQYPITDDAAVRFAGMFYKSLVAGQPVEKALTAARVLMHATSKIEWGIPVLFTRANSDALFRVERSPVMPAAAAPMAAPIVIPATPAAPEARAAAPAAVPGPAPALSDYEMNKRQAQASLRRLFA